MVQTGKIILLFTFLLLNGVLVGCDKCKRPLSEEKSELEKLEAEEKVLMETVKKQVGPVSWKENVEKEIERVKKSAGRSTGELNALLRSFPEKIKALAEIENGRKSSDFEKDKIIDRYFFEFKDKEYNDRGQKAYMYYGDKQEVPLIKQYLIDLLALYQNLQKQAELKK